MTDWKENEFRLGRIHDNDDEKRAYAQMFLRSGRLGSDGRTRTFHVNARGLLKGKSSKAIDYVSRSGVYEKKNEDLQSTGGRTVGEIKSILQSVEDATSRKNGRVAVSIVFELPLEMPTANREQVTKRISEELDADGYPNHWAIHTKGKNGDQPHVHFLVTARAFINGEVMPEGRPGRPAKRFLKDRAEVRSLREKIARIINREQEQYGGWQRFHPGKLRDTGISRPAFPRVPETLWKSRTKPKSRARRIKSLVTHGTAETHKLIQDDRTAWAQQRKKEKLRRAEEKTKHLKQKVKKATNRVFEAEARVRRISKPKVMRPPTIKQQTWIKDVAHKFGIKPPEIVWKDGGEGMAWIKAITGSEHASSIRKTLPTNTSDRAVSGKLNTHIPRPAHSSTDLKQTLIGVSKLLKQRATKSASAQSTERQVLKSNQRRGGINDE